jgi:hypothetical protein
VEDSLTEELCNLSLNAISGTNNNECIKIQSLVQNKVMLILIDSGSSHSFVSSQFVEIAGLSTTSINPKRVQLPNGQMLISDKMVPKLEWWCQGHTMTVDMRVLNMGAYDAILGYDWLKHHSPMKCHWVDRTIELWDLGRQIKLQGVKPPELQVQPVEAEHLWKAVKGNGIWAFAVVECVQQAEDQAIPDSIQEVIDQFPELFTDPKQLPPSRAYDHAIPLQPDAVPINCKPYKYSPQHKTEI